jgi:hypothetical protein
MEGHHIPMNRQNSHCENGYTIESHLYGQCNPCQNSNHILHRDRKINPKVGGQKSSLISKAILRKKTDARGITIPDFKLYIQPW